MTKTVFFIILAVFILMAVFGGLTWFGNRFQSIEKGLIVWGSGTLDGVKNFFIHFSSVTALLEERDLARKESGELRLRNAELELLSNENAELRKLANLKNEKRISLISGRLYGFQSVEQHKGFFSAGERDGIRAGQWVIGSSGGIVGIISDVRDTASMVTFLSFPELSVQAVGGSTREVIGVTQGGNQVEITLGLIPKQVVLKEGAVIFSAIEGTRSKEYFIGTVETVSSQPSDLFQSAVVALQEPFSKVMYGAAVAE